MYKRYKKSKNTKNQETTKRYRNRDTKYKNMEIQTYKDNIREYTQHSTTNNNVIITTIMPGTHYWQAFFTKQQTREPWQRMPCGMGPGKKWTYTTV